MISQGKNIPYPSYEKDRKLSDEMNKTNDLEHIFIENNEGNRFKSIYFS